MGHLKISETKYNAGDYHELKNKVENLSKQIDEIKQNMVRYFVAYYFIKINKY